VAAGTTPTEENGKFIDGQGLKYTKYQFEKNKVVGNASTLREKIRANTLPAEHIVKSGTLGEFEMIFNGEDYTGYWVRGYFIAPKTTKYKFYVSGDDTVEFYFNPIANVPSIDSALPRTCYVCGYHNFRNYDYYPRSCDKIISDEYDLEEGKYYYMELFAFNYGT